MELRRGVQMMLIIALLAGLFSLIDPATSHAASSRQIECQAGGSRDFAVATHAEFNSAVACFNAGTPGTGEYRIRLAADITQPLDLTGDEVSAFTPVDQDQLDRSLVIDGNRFAIRFPEGPPEQGSGLGAVVLMAETNRAPVTFTNISIAGRGFFDRLISNLGTGSLTIEQSDLFQGVGPTIAVDARGVNSLTIRTARLRGDVRVEAVSVDMSESAITGGRSLIIAGAQAELAIVNSTFEASTDAPQAAIQVLESGSVTGRIANSTFTGDAFTSETTDNFTITMQSNLIAGSCASGVFDGGSNVGGCFGDPIDVGRPNSTGCFRRTVLNCVLIVPLTADSPALGAGDCTGLATDQRGYQRIPAGPGCDAGVYEALDLKPVTVVCEPGGDRDFLVGTEVDFNAAIECFNQGTPGSGSYLISLAHDLVLEDPRRGELTIAEPINQPSAGLDLTIDGQGHRLVVAESPGGPFGGPPDAGVLLATTEPNRARATMRNIELLSDNIFTTTLLVHQADARLTIERSVLGLNGLTERALEGQGSGEIIIHRSVVTGTAAIIVEGPALTVTDSHIANPSFSNSTLSLGYDGDDLSISNSTIDAAILLVDSATASISNSTLLGRGIVGGDLSNVTSRSNIINECNETLVDGGNNVGGCFGDQIVLAAPADNGCELAAASICPFTVALGAASPAVGAGLCSGVGLDQRGKPRTPAGLGCDAGSYERLDFDPTIDERGDVDRSGIVDAQDVIALLDYLAGNTRPALLAAGDLNGDNEIRLDDVLLLAQEL